MKNHFVLCNTTQNFKQFGFQGYLHILIFHLFKNLELSHQERAF